MTCTAFTLMTSGTAVAAEDLPQVPQVLKAGQACTPSSGKKVTELPWQLPFLGSQRMLSLTDGAGAVVAVVDTGADSAAVRADAVGDAADCVGHGTAMAGLISGSSAKDGGVAPGAKVLAIRGTDKFGVATAASLATAIDAAVGAGARIICVGPVVANPDPALRQAVERARAAGALVVAAAGPDAAAPGPFYPAAFPGVLSVASIGPDGKPVAAQDGKPGPSGVLSAPGNLVVGIGPGGGHVVASGPAFAAAHVAGVAALVLSYRQKASADELFQRLVNTAYPQQGGAVVDPLAAMTVDKDRDRPTPQREPVEVAPLPDLAGARLGAWQVVGVAALVAALVGALAVVLPLGRRRKWRAGRVG